MPTTTITLDETLAARVAEVAAHAGQPVDEFVQRVLRRVADADVQFERGLPALRRRPGAPTLTVEDVDRLLDKDEA